MKEFTEEFDFNVFRALFALKSNDERIINYVLTSKHEEYKEDSNNPYLIAATYIKLDRRVTVYWYRKPDDAPTYIVQNAGNITVIVSFIKKHEFDSLIQFHFPSLLLK